ncbi:hypothetical protein BZA05DRAFT_331567 [Tricharina praecox]|uniref:uncharacterized protein n=1 Tax=Tricharina praecox TaxID=43433 RepID=UPI00221FAFAF|nr:uncharacterized protein BZA05DRAFT_331567 [Tricharina praecox]KAI5858150.1 hypothetical protein BZA05DRAFT_331567 [Tricharina praecox]
MHRYTWWFEFVCLMSSATAIAITTGLLIHFDGREIPAWATAGSGLSLNSILSVFSTMSRASLLVPIDQSIGQLYWLAVSKQGRQLSEVELYNEAARGPYGAMRLLWMKRGTGLVSMGCVLTIMVVILGFAQQQLISYPTRTFTTRDPRNLTLVGRSLETYDTFQEITTMQGVSVPSVEFAVTSSVFSSLVHYVVHDPLYRCDSGNCEYPAFATLGICSHCDYAQNEIVSACDGDRDHCWATYRDLVGHAWKHTDENAYSTIINQTTNTDSAPIVETFTLNVSIATWPPTYNAWACEIYWCIRSVNATVIDSTYRERELGEYNRSTVQPDGSALFQYTDLENQAKNFTVTRNAQLAFKNLGLTLRGWSQKSRRGQWVHSSPLFGGIAAFATADMTVGGEHMHRHKKNPIAVMADGMSNAIRTSLSARGKKVERRTIIVVRWWWMVYPAAIWIFSAVFAWGVVCTTKLHDEFVGAWGCSSIALLLWGVDDDVKERVGDWSAEGMAKKADNIIVKLMRDGDGWKLKEVKGSEGFGP